MKEILEQYLKHKGYNDITLICYNTNGGNCNISYRKANTVYHEDINIWDMILFLYEENQMKTQWKHNETYT